MTTTITLPESSALDRVEQSNEALTKAMRALHAVKPGDFDGLVSATSAVGALLSESEGFAEALASAESIMDRTRRVVESHNRKTLTVVGEWLERYPRGPKSLRGFTTSLALALYGPKRDDTGAPVLSKTGKPEPKPGSLMSVKRMTEAVMVKRAYAEAHKANPAIEVPSNAEIKTATQNLTGEQVEALIEDARKGKPLTTPKATESTPKPVTPAVAIKRLGDAIDALKRVPSLTDTERAEVRRLIESATTVLTGIKMTPAESVPVTQK